ncbi:MAG TPA: phenylalanine--tRNA ligase subunit beta [Candidatus Portnoybacteria bacterium]|nr:phenylalanine--tRNA ligase subunit beta [Candidatus Portnoybacteria bacterium]
MNILISYSWLKDYVKTSASPEEIARLLSLHAFSVEKIISQGKDDIFEIEITPNRGDALSVLGIARELKAILPMQGKSADWLAKFPAKAAKGEDKYNLAVEIKDKSLVPRFSAVVLDNIKIKPSPETIQRRLEAVGTRALNNVIDITNYLMFDKGQPMHAFDYDKILGAKMIMRESRQGEKLTTLDGVERTLPAGVIVIEDGEGRLIDLCGIMGAKNSEVDENTKRVLLFVQVYDPVRIRKSSMALGHRTEAALRFEKGVDFEGVVPALWEAVSFLQQEAGACVASKLIDIVNVKIEPKKVAVDYGRINQVAGVEIKKEIVDKILQNLGFVFNGTSVIVPSWRQGDIEIAEDLAEEVIRLYGYDNLPNNLLTGEVPRQIVEPIFQTENKARLYLKHQGFFECYTKSAVSQALAGEGAVKIANPLNEDFVYLKTSLIPSLVGVLEKNQGYNEKIKIFELASVYLQKKNDLPEQPLRLSLASRGLDYLEFKGIVEGLMRELGVACDFAIQELGDQVLGVELDFEAIAKGAGQVKAYVPISTFNSIKEDLTLVVPPGVAYEKINQVIANADKRVKKLEFKDIYKNFLTLAIEYHDSAKQVSSEQAQEIRKNIFEQLDKKLGVKLKT